MQQARTTSHRTGQAEDGIKLKLIRRAQKDWERDCRRFEDLVIEQALTKRLRTGGHAARMK